MPFVRVSRDKRGYETIYLVHTSQRRGRPATTRVLYAFRTPPGVKVGRDPFDAEVRRTLEAQNPGVEFDWERLSNIPTPPPDVEHWRERRRAEKAAKQARKAEELEESADPDQAELEGGSDEPARLSAESDSPSAKDGAVEAVAQSTGGTTTGTDGQARAGASGTDGVGPRRTGKRRRRRRGARKPAGPGGTQPTTGEPAVSGVPPPADGDSGDGGEDVA